VTLAFAPSEPTISRHLRMLREAGPADGRRRGTWIYQRARPGVTRQPAGRLAIGAPVPDHA
jgi:ArsR family transcriptional regulator, arsenate/arsenite/antimonite-responsive transcriptional repressor